MIIADGDPTIFLVRPLSGTLMAFSALLLIIVCMPAISRKREEIFVEE
jgi:putative tricarboxylic transport membrane protein